MLFRSIMIEFNPEATSTQMEVFEEELKAVADKIPYKKSFRCGFNRRLETEAALDVSRRKLKFMCHNSSPSGNSTRMTI